MESDLRLRLTLASRASVLRNSVCPLMVITMFRMQLDRATCLVAAVCAAACGKSVVPIAQRTSSASAADRVRRAAPSDTTFFEVSRHEDRGKMNARGQCTWGLESIPGPGDTLIGILREGHTISVDPHTCVRVEAYGYRRTAPPMDTAGGERRSLTVTLDSTRLHSVRRPKGQ